MPIPGTQEIRKPLLEAFKGEAPHSFAINDFLELTAGYFGVALNDLSSGDKNILKTRISEAKNDLKKNNLISNPSKNTYMITNAGSEVLEDNPDIITDEYLSSRNHKALAQADALTLDLPVSEQEHDELITADSETITEEFEPSAEDSMTQEIGSTEEITETEEIGTESDFSDKEFDNAPDEPVDVYAENEEIYEADDSEPDTGNIMAEDNSDSAVDEPEPEHEPEPYTQEVESDSVNDSGYGIDEVIAKHNSALAEELLTRTAALPSDRFEMLVIDLLSKMGYFAFRTARYTTESSGSDLIHGVILDNKTGANIYIQARKLSPERTIGRADIQDFVGELSDKGGKGIFATTANFSENAKIYANDERIMLIDGARLTSLMIAHNFCVNVEKVYEVKAIDTESFSEYEE